MTPKPLLRWDRFWCNPSKSVYSDLDGFLLDPDDSMLTPNPNCLPTREILKAQCLVMLGEPGMGKSSVLEGLHEATTGRKKHFSLEACASAENLERKLFESQQVQEWVASEDDLHLFLDALDEGLLRVQIIAQALSAGLKDLPVERLSLRITCRTAQWPTYLTERLSKLWPHSFGQYELLPLRQLDVHTAASAHGLDSAEFLKQVLDRKVVPLAIKPVTLFFLLNTFQRDRQLPSSQRDLFQKGCKRLCEEFNSSRLASKLVSKFPLDDIVACARKVAVFTLLGGRPSIFQATDDGRAGDQDYLLDQLSELTKVPISLLTDTIETALFSSRGEPRLGWAHHSYAEYLAGRYLSERNLDLPTLKQIFFEPETGMCVPQLSECAAWVASSHPEFFSYIAERQPELLVSSQVVFESESDLRLLVERTLAAFDRLAMPDTTVRRGFGKLKHQDLAKSLAPWISNQQASFLARRAAIEIARVCEVTSLLPQIEKVLEDPSEDVALRVKAALAVAKVGDRASQQKLGFCLDGLPEDEQDELKGIALITLWRGLDPETLFKLLAAPKDDHFMGNYYWFLAHTLPQEICEQDLPLALEWIRNLKARDDYLVSSISGELVKRAAQITSLALAPPMATYWAWRSKADSRLDQRVVTEFTEKCKRNLEFRRSFVESFVADADLSPPQGVAWSLRNFLMPEDTLWIVEQFSHSDLSKQPIWGRLLSAKLNESDSAHFDAVCQAVVSDPRLREYVSHLDDPPLPVVPDVTPQKESETLEPPTEETKPKLQPLFSAINSSNPEHWLTALHTYWRREAYGCDRPIDSFPGFSQLSGVERNLLIEKAAVFLEHYDCTDNAWFITNNLPLYVVEAARAFDFLFKCHPTALNKRDCRFWARWLPTLLARLDCEKKTLLPVLKLAERACPLEFVALATERISAEARNHGYIFVLQHLEDLWSEELGTALLTAFQQWNGRYPEASVQLLVSLASRDFRPALDFAIDAVEKSNEFTPLQLAGAIALTYSRPGDFWERIWTVVTREDEIFEQFALALVGMSDSNARKALTFLSDEQLAMLYEKLLRLFPPETDGWKSGGQMVGPRQELGDWRNEALERLSVRGTVRAAQLVERLADSFPDAIHLRLRVKEVWKNTALERWKPMAAEELAKLLRDGTFSGGALERFTWLHLTDFHFGLEGQACLWPNLREPFLEDLARLHESTGPWQAVLFTGDFVQAGKSKEFSDMQTKVLEKLWSKLQDLGSADAVLLAVPGNHDLVRPDTKKGSAALTAILERGGFAKIEAEFWSKPSSSYRQIVKSCLNNYVSWWRTNELRPKSIKDGLLPGDFSYSFEVGSKRVGIVGLNTTFLQLKGGDYQGHLSWNARQLHEVCDGDAPNWVKSHDACILLTHQGPAWLSNQARDHDWTEIAPPGRFAVHLYGHMHEPTLTQITVGNSPHSRLEFQGRSVFGMERFGEPPTTVRSHGYAVGQIDFSGQQITIRFWPRKASNATGEWRFHSDNERAHLEKDEGTAGVVLGTAPSAGRSLSKRSD